MSKRMLGAWGSAAAATLVLVGLAGQARSDNETPQPPPNPAGASTPQPAASSGSSSNLQWEAIAERFTGYKADTKPSRDVTMQFPASTEIKEIKCVGGQVVKKGDVLIRARDSDIVASIAQQRDLAENTLEIIGAEKQAALAQFKFDRLKNGGTYSPTEYREAEIAAEVARVQLDQAKKNKIQQELRLKQAEASYERYYLEAPFAGIVEEVMIEIGEGVTEQTKVLRLVNIEKMWLDPYASTPETIRLQLKEGSPAWVLVDMPDSPRLVQGKVLYVSPVADSVSQTRRVRVEIENLEAWPAGTQARVRFTDPGSDWEKYKSPSGTVSSSPPITVVGMADEVMAGRCGIPCVLSLCDWMNGHGLVIHSNTPTEVVRRFEADQVRETVVAMLSDAENRTSLLAGGDQVDGKMFFVPGDGPPARKRVRYIPTFSESTGAEGERK